MDPAIPEPALIVPDGPSGGDLTLPGSGCGSCDSVALHRSLLRAAAADGADPRRLARDAGLSGRVLACDEAMIPAHYYMRLWELVERALENPLVPLTIATRHRVGELGLYDYLYTTVATLREGMAAAREFLHLVTTNGRLEIHPGPERESAYTYRQVDPGGRGGELCSQFTAALWCVRARAATGRHVAPVHVALPTAAPRSRHPFVEAFGTYRVDFGAPVSSVTFRAADLGMPMTGADPRLTSILRRYAASLPPPRAVTFLEVFRVALAEAIERSAPSLHEVAGRLTVSPRTLQRRLAEHGTTWRAELDAARRSAASSSSARPVKMASLAHRLGYADPRSARRALRRWAEATALDPMSHHATLHGPPSRRKSARPACWATSADGLNAPMSVAGPERGRVAGVSGPRLGAPCPRR